MEATDAIHEANERFMKAVRERDSATMPDLYTRDAKILPPHGDAVSGRDAIAAYWTSFFDLGIAESRPETQEVIPMGEYALEVGEFQAFRADHTLVDRGKIMVLWKNDRGVWKMHRDTWNTSQPLPVE
jgi:uncharacterized protein (TIGR02246 family)